MRALTLLTPPTVEPVGLGDLQDWLPQDTGVDEPKILGIIASVRKELENKLQRAFINQTWELALDAREIEDVIYLPRPPLVSITSIKAYSLTNTESTVPVSYYAVDPGEGARVWLNYGQVWNAVWATDFRAQRSLVVTYVSGYGTVATAVPIEVRKAIKELVALDYWHPLTGRVSPDGALVDDLKAARDLVFTRVSHLESEWVAL